MEEAQRSRVVYHHDVFSPCYFLKEAVNAIRKCLGLESNPNAKDDQSSSTSDGKPRGPPSTETDPPTNDPSVEDLARRGRPPPRPGVSGGRDPQTN